MIEVKTAKKIDDIAGKICKAVIPVRNEFYLGKGTQIGICTLASLDLLATLSKTEAVMDNVAIVGRLLSENKGIDTMIKFADEHTGLTRLLICGKEVKGHRAGQALLALARNGTDQSGRIIGALGPYPILESKFELIEKFRKRVEVVDLVGTVDADHITRLVS